MEEIHNIITEPLTTAAERYYKKQLARCSKYQKAHKEKVNESSSKSYHKMAHDEERLKEFKEKKKIYIFKK